MNLIDYIIIALLVLALIRGLVRGAIVIILDLVGFIISIGATFWLSPFIEPIIRRFVNYSDQLIRPIAFLASYLIIQLIWTIVSWFVQRLTNKFDQTIINKLFGMAVSVAYSTVLIGIVLILIENLPLDRQQRDTIGHSRLSGRIVAVTQPIRRPIERTLKTAIDQVTQTITIRPESDERLTLRINPTKLIPNPAAQAKMFDLVNQERQKVGAKPLQPSNALESVAQAHAIDMWQRHYFAHTNPDGQDSFDRLQAARVEFVNAGENLALAPTIDLAHTGLMNSPGHRANILESSFGHIGIGVISGPPFGEMVVQEFTD